MSDVKKKSMYTLRRNLKEWDRWIDFEYRLRTVYTKWNSQKKSHNKNGVVFTKTKECITFKSSGFGYITFYIFILWRTLKLYNITQFKRGVSRVRDPWCGESRTMILYTWLSLRFSPFSTKFYTFPGWSNLPKCWVNVFQILWPV